MLSDSDLDAESEKTCRQRLWRRQRRQRRSGSEARWSCRARLTFPAQQEVQAKDRNPQADLSARSPASLPVLLLARLTHKASWGLDVWAQRLSFKDKTSLKTCSDTWVLISFSDMTFRDDCSSCHCHVIRWGCWFKDCYFIFQKQMLKKKHMMCHDLHLVTYCISCEKFRVKSFLWKFEFPYRKTKCEIQRNKCSRALFFLV